ncbi:S-DNA-T family DNA segregation ATPase FtsK/SpoIIIE [Kineothrix alysoides]|uniref:S-DNA-T family DNA segregation ATPase FtsK/SpoIIIE n=1 Tax=Kineothrix alysoides TaxID=1469948 RepID=A0A4R1R160_9FIRM|nr:type VII secretion protein EssC [Kineothrix alysoides]TCL59042.1 S-DNA-T family DNA segregation ATPase FtsK/SpoIIIE [Kineothrix alysoides]
MSLLMTIVFENGFQEIYLPAVNNKTVPTDIRPHISGWRGDITLPLEVWDNIWSMSDSRQFVITQNERPVSKVNLTPGLLLNCVMKDDEDTVFSITVNKVNDGNTHFDKYFLDAAGCPWVKIGSAEDNVIRYGNQFCSPKHAEIIIEGSIAKVKDLGSVNGTFVNGRTLTGEKQLHYGDVIYIIGLKIVYLGNVLAINNPGGDCVVDDLKLKRISIASSGEEEGSEYEAEEIYFLRTPRKLEALDNETFTIEKCPARNRQKKQPVIFTIGPAFTMMIPMIAGVMMMSGEGQGALGGLIMSVGAALIGAMWAILNIRYQNKEEAETEASRVASYTTYIAKTADRIKDKIEYNRGILSRMLPSGKEAVSFAMDGSPRLWEKSNVHEDFLTVRLGKGDIPSPNSIAVPKEQLMAEHDPLNDKVEEIQAAMSMLKNVPVGLSLYDNRMVGVVSKSREKVLNMGRLLATQVAGLHPYTDVRLCYVYPLRETDSWNYTHFLPHVWTPDGKLRMLASDKNTVGDVMYHLSGVIRERLEKETEGKDDENARILPHYVVVVADWSLVEEEPIAKYLMNPTPELGMTVIYLTDAIDKLPSGCTAIVQDDEKNCSFYSTTGSFRQQENVDYDEVSAEEIQQFARSLSNYKIRELGVSTAIPDVLTFLDMYKISRVEDLDMLHKWLENRTYESMKSMVGYKSGNQPLFLDIHEKYHGPHGLVAGTTGSGKSETLQSYILSLVVNYHPHEVAFILIDYKGGGMAQSFLGLPHLSGVITNLGGNATNRALLSINAEIKSRQRIFNDYKVKHIDAYIELYRSGVANEPMPHLLIIADEFAELKKEQPEFVRALVSAARVGRSLGVNLILATQKPSGVVDDEIWSNTRFRLCLRVADKQDSSEMLKRPDAAFITGTGRGYFQVGNDEIFEEFQSGWSGAEYEPGIPFTDDKNAKVELINLIGKNDVPKQKKKKKSDNIAKVTQLDAVVKYAAQIAQENSIPAIKQIWMPPLPARLYLEELETIAKPQGFSLLLPIGLADNPEGQNQYPVAVDFLNDGHLLICGAGGAGKTTLLQTLIYSAAQRYTAKEVNIYIADFSSRTMAVFGSLPHVGGVLFEGDDEKISEVFALMQNTLAQRKSEFSRQGIGSYKEYVTQKDDCPAILFIIDNYVAFIEGYDQYEDTLAQLSREAASYGIYLVLTMNNSGELRSRIRQNFINGIALQMPDRFEYEAVIGDRTEIIPEGRTSGRGLMKAPQPVEFQVALCLKEDEGLSQAQTLRRRFASMQPSQGEGVRKIGNKLDSLSFETLMDRDDVKALPDHCIALGLDVEEGKLAEIDLDDEFCYAISGCGGSGKTNLLASIAKQTKQKGARVFLFDSEDSLLEKHISADRTVHDAAELFSLMEEVIVSEFSSRNGVVADARDAGQDVRKATEQFDRIIFLINDMTAFMSAVYSPDMDMSSFMEIALEKGKHHKIQFIAAVTPDDHADMARYACMRIFAGYGRGIHLGGMFDQQSILRFEMSSADYVRQLPAGVGYVAGSSAGAVKIITPMIKESAKKEEADV